MSESPYGLIWRHGTRPFGTLGSPRQHPTLGTVNEARVVDDDDQALGVGETGELLLRNPTVTPGYWGMPEETAAAVVDGWMHTGDLVTVNDDGTYTFVARRKEVLRRRGLNLSPAEVEDAIGSHPDVLEVAVVGVPSELTEDEVKAFVVAEHGRVLDFAELRAWTGERLSAFKVPRFWQQIDALPRTPTSRIAKHRLAGRASTRRVRRRGRPRRSEGLTAGRTPRHANCGAGTRSGRTRSSSARPGRSRRERCRSCRGRRRSAPCCRRRTRCTRAGSSISPGS